MAETLALDGYRLEVSVVDHDPGGGPATARLAVVPTEEACPECLVPQSVLAGIAADALGPSWRVEVHYPQGPQAAGS